jgi:hypothetical protein
MQRIIQNVLGSRSYRQEISRKPQERRVVNSAEPAAASTRVRAISGLTGQIIANKKKKDSSDEQWSNHAPPKFVDAVLPWIQTMTQMKISKMKPQKTGTAWNLGLYRSVLFTE